MPVETRQLHALVVMYDIRGFSTAARRIAEPLYGAFITQAHALILSLLGTPTPVFVKNLGDGNLLIWELAGPDPVLAAPLVLQLSRACLAAQYEYRALAARQAFEGSWHLPRDLGFGLTVGPVTHGDDYYGNAINVAARLQDCARPRGLILEEAAFELLGAEAGRLGEPFTLERAALKGVGRVRYAWFKRLTRRERVGRRARRLARLLWPVAAPLALLAWIDGGLPFPAGPTLRGAIDELDVSLLRPHQDRATLDRRADALRERLLAELRTQVDPRVHRFYVGPGGTPDFLAWTDGQALSALLTSPPSSSSRAGVQAMALRSLDALFAGRPTASGGPMIEWTEGEGFWRHATEPHPHFESTAWVLWALVLAHGEPARGGLDDAARQRLAGYTRRVWQALRGFHDPVCGGWHYRLRQAAHNAYGDPEPSNLHFASTYHAVISGLVLVEALRLGVPLEQSDRFLRRSVDFLLRHHLPAGGGWPGAYTPADGRFLPNATPPDCREGLSLQAYALLLRVRRLAPEVLPGGQLPAALAQSLVETVRRLKDRTLSEPPSTQRWVVNVLGRDGQPRRSRDGMDFYGLPWGLATARLQVDHARTPRQRVEALRALTRLMSLAEAQAAADLEARSSVVSVAELALALGLR